MSATDLRYDFVVDTAQDNNTHNMTIAAVGRGRRVLDVGCSTGYLAEFLAKHRGCEVSGLEPDPASAAAARRRLGDRVLLGGTELLPSFAPGCFDVVLFADVLEHLMDPGQALRDARRLLAPGGYVVASIPNVAHGDVRLMLLAGHFDYRRTGLLDSTHARFLTRHTIPRLFARSGYRLTSTASKTVPLGQTEFGIALDRFPPDVVAAVRSDDHHADYQYVVKAAPDLGARVQLQGPATWQRSSLIEQWARAFSPAEPVRLALPVHDDDAAVAEAVAVIDEQCRRAGTTVDAVADVELVRCEGPLVLPEWTVLSADCDVPGLRQLALPPLDVLVP